MLDYIYHNTLGLPVNLISVVKTLIFCQYVRNVAMNVMSNKRGKTQESIQSSTTSDPGYLMGKCQNTIKHHRRESKGQPFQAGDQKATMKRRESMTNTRHK